MNTSMANVKNCCTLVNQICTLCSITVKELSPDYKCRTPKISLHTEVSGDAVLPWQHSPKKGDFEYVHFTVCPLQFASDPTVDNIQLVR